MARDPVLIHAGNAADAERRYGVPASVILGLLKQEGGTDANGRPVAPGDGAGPPSFGQFTYGTGASLGIRYGDSKSEVDGVARYLLQNGYKTDPERAIGAYNGGPGNPQYSYAAKVLALAKNYVGFDAGGKGAAAAAAAPNPISQPAPAPAPSAGKLTTPEQHNTLVVFGVQAALVLAGVVAVAVGVSRAAGVRAAGAS